MVISNNEDDVCPIVDADAVAEIYDVPAVELKEVRFDFSMPSCLVAPEGREELVVGWEAVRSYDELRSAFNPQLMNEPTDIDGLGDRAFIVLSDQFEDDRVNLHFEIDGVTVSVYGLPSDDPLDPAADVRAVAEAVAQRVRFAGVATTP